MTGYTVLTAILMVGGLGPAAWLGARGRPEHRLVGLEIGGPVTVLILMLLSQVTGQSSSLIVPLVLALLSVAGTLVFTRLLAPPNSVRSSVGKNAAQR
jgi:multisubunit Na+/H+ antiporter MnhF subunit